MFMENIARRISIFSERTEKRRKEKRVVKEPIRVSPPRRPVEAIRISQNVLDRYREKTSGNSLTASPTDTSSRDGHSGSQTSRGRMEGQGSDPPDMLFLILKTQIRRGKRARIALKDYEKQWQMEQAVSDDLQKRWGSSARVRPHEAVRARLQTRNSVRQRYEECRRVARKLESNIAELKHCIAEQYVRWNTRERREFLEEQLQLCTEPQFCEHCFREMIYSDVMYEAVPHVQQLRHAQKHAAGAGDVEHVDKYPTFQQVEKKLQGKLPAERGCLQCFSVVYCCSEHRIEDEEHHKTFCCAALANLKMVDLDTLFEPFNPSGYGMVQAGDFFSKSVDRVGQILENYETMHNRRLLDMRDLRRWTREIEREGPMTARTDRSKSSNVDEGDNRDEDGKSLELRLGEVANYLKRISEQQSGIRKYGSQHGVLSVLGDTSRGPSSGGDDVFDPITQFKVVQTLVELRETLKLRDEEAKSYKLQRDDALQTLKESQELFSREFSRQRKLFDAEKVKLAKEREKVALLRRRLANVSKTQQHSFPSPDTPSMLHSAHVSRALMVDALVQTDDSSLKSKLQFVQRQLKSLRIKHGEIRTTFNQQRGLAELEISEAREFIGKLIGISDPVEEEETAKDSGAGARHLTNGEHSDRQVPVEIQLNNTAVNHGNQAASDSQSTSSSDQSSSTSSSSNDASTSSRSKSKRRLSKSVPKKKKKNSNNGQQKTQHNHRSQSQESSQSVSKLNLQPF